MYYSGSERDPPSSQQHPPRHESSGSVRLFKGISSGNNGEV